MSQAPPPPNASQPYYSHQPPAYKPRSNGFGVAGLVFGILGIFTCGILSPIGLLLSFLGMFKAPRFAASVGLIISFLGSLVIGGIAIAIIAAVYPAMNTAEVIKTRAEAKIDSYVATNGSLPDSFTGTQLIAGIPDAWGNDMEYERLTPNTFRIISSGYDEQFGTPLDVYYNQTVENAGEGNWTMGTPPGR